MTPRSARSVRLVMVPAAQARDKHEPDAKVAENLGGDQRLVRS